MNQIRQMPRMILLKKLKISPQRHRDFKPDFQKINFLMRKVKFSYTKHQIC